MSDQFNPNEPGSPAPDFSSPPPPIASPTPSGSPEITSDDKLFVLLAYVLSPLIPIVILFLEDKKNRPFIRAHNAQALVWGGLNLVIGSFLSVFLCGIPSLVMWGIAIYWGIKGYQGQYVTIPVITDFVKNQGLA
ncbi:MAG: hypothetical protein WCI88_03155 [Chloroflexota bacterium]